MRVALTLAGIFSEYESVESEARRERFAAEMEAVLKHEPNIVGVFSVWEPNALDGMDAQYAGQAGSSPSGQFIPWVHQRSGPVEFHSFNEYEEETRLMSGNETASNPYPQTIMGKDTFLVRLRAPVINPRTNEVVAVVGVNVDISALQEVVDQAIEQNEDIVYMSVYTNDGSIIGSYVPELVGQNIHQADAGLFANHMNDVAGAIQKGATTSVEEYSSVAHSDLEIVMNPFTISKTTTPWAMGIGTPKNIILAEVNQMKIFTMAVALIAVLVVAFVIYLVAGSITKPIVNVAMTLKDISEGEGDLTKTVNVNSKDEVGDLARYFNATLGKIRNLVVTIKRQAESLFDIGNELSSNMTETAAAINEITSNITSIKGRVLNQSASVTETNATMQQITVNIDKLNDNVENQSTSVTKSSCAIEEMIANIQSVTNTLTKNSESVQSLLESSEVGRNSLEEVAADIQEIAQESKGLLEINSVMANIAAETNILSVNAAIEAAHAGAAGKGFAVVADEIRQLAEDSSKQSKTTSAVLKKIMESIDKISRSTSTVLRKFEAIDKGVKIVSEQSENIRTAMEEQSAGSRQILEVIGQLNDITRMVKGGSDEMLEGSKEVITEGKNLEMVTQEITHGMNEMATGANQINVAVHRVNEISGQNRENINVLVKEVSRFKVA
jgi:methyl-accepting chemotaxis protein